VTLTEYLSNKPLETRLAITVFLITELFVDALDELSDSDDDVEMLFKVTLLGAKLFEIAQKNNVDLTPKSTLKAVKSMRAKVDVDEITPRELALAVSKLIVEDKLETIKN